MKSRLTWRATASANMPWSCGTNDRGENGRKITSSPALKVLNEMTEMSEGEIYEVVTVEKR